jgi:hypothetical protein
VNKRFGEPPPVEVTIVGCRINLLYFYHQDHISSGFITMVVANPEISTFLIYCSAFEFIADIEPSI